MNQTEKSYKKAGLALSGGFIRATAQIGVIEVLEEHNVPIKLVSGCSSGAIIASAYVSGTLPLLKKRLIEGASRDYWQVIFEPTLSIGGLLRGERNRKFFEEFVGEKDFSDLDKQLILAATDLKTLTEVMLVEGKISKAIQAATSVPGIFVPVEWSGRLLVDGANFNMIPSRFLYQMGADYVIAVDVSKPPNLFARSLAGLKRWRHKLEVTKNFNNQGDLNVFQLVRRAVHLSSSKIENFSSRSYPYDVLVRPLVENVKRTEFNLAKYCIDEGRMAALDVLPKIKRDLVLF